MPITINGTGPITGSDRSALGANTDITSLGNLASINGGQLAGMRNVIINGACDIAQRGPLVGSAGAAGYGGPDRFQSTNSVAGGQFTQSAQTLTFGGQVKNSVRQTVDTATTAFTTTNYWSGISQRIEGLNAYHLKDKPFVVSFIFNTNLSGTYSVVVQDATGGYSYVSTFTAVANTPIRVSVAIPVITGAASIPRTNALGLLVNVGFLNQATYQTATLNSWLTGNFYTASTQTIWSATAGNFIELTELQVEAGTVATPFERRSYGVELAVCQRYYETGNIYYEGYAALATNPVGGINSTFKQPKRATPSLVYSGFTNVANAAVGATRTVYTDSFERYALSVAAGVVTAREQWAASSEL